VDNPLVLFTNPWLVVLLALLIFAGRVIILAKRLKAAARNPTLVDLRALDEAKKALDAHHHSLDEAKRTRDREIEGARDALRNYKRPLKKAVDGRRGELAAEMKALAHFDAALVAARATKDRTLKSAKSQATVRKPAQGRVRRRRNSSKDM